MRLTTVKANTENITRSEVSAAHFIPYRCHWNSNTIMTYKDELIRIVKIKGFAFETADDEEIDLKKNSRNNLLKAMSTGNFSLYFHTTRRKEKGFPDGEMPDTFSQKINQEWKYKHSDDRSFVNEHYITIIRGSDQSSIAAIEGMIKNLQHKADKSSWEYDMQAAFEEIEEMTERVLNGFGNYGAELLGLVETEKCVISEPLGFLSRLVNAG